MTQKVKEEMERGTLSCAASLRQSPVEEAGSAVGAPPAPVLGGPTLCQSQHSPLESWGWTGVERVPPSGPGVGGESRAVLTHVNRHRRA